MKYKMIMFDMDGTLLPMDQNVFINGYFSLLCKKVSNKIDADDFIKAIWSGVKAMGASNGLITNKEAFWNNFKLKTGLDEQYFEKVCDDFYANDFKKAIKFTYPNLMAKEAIKIAHEKADRVILATNPLFPIVAQITRLSFVNLDAKDFDYITAYEDQYYIKPDIRYYMSLLKRFDIDPNECLMIGNDEYEDAYPCQKIGIDFYLVDDHLIKSDKYPYVCKQGSFKYLLSYLSSLDNR